MGCILEQSFGHCTSAGKDDLADVFVVAFLIGENVAICFLEYVDEMGLECISNRWMLGGRDDTVLFLEVFGLFEFYLERMRDRHCHVLATTVHQTECLNNPVFDDGELSLGRADIDDEHWEEFASEHCANMTKDLNLETIDGETRLLQYLAVFRECFVEGCDDEY